MRTSTNQLSVEGTLVNGYDYTNQAWVINGIYQDCGHPQAGQSMIDICADNPITAPRTIFEGCNCYGRTHVGEKAQV